MIKIYANLSTVSLSKPFFLIIYYSYYLVKWTVTELKNKVRSDIIAHIAAQLDSIDFFQNHTFLKRYFAFVKIVFLIDFLFQKRRSDL